MRALIFLFICSFAFNQGCRNQDNDFSIQPPVGYTSSKLVTPAEGDIIKAGSTINITWSGFKIPVVRLELWKKKLYYEQVIVNELINNGSFTWNVPSETVASVSYQIKLVDAENENDFIYSGVFTIK
jgi:hypothetical protein